MGALKIGTHSIKGGVRSQFKELKGDACKVKGIADDVSGKKEYPSESSR